MIHRLRTRFAKLIVDHLRRPRSLDIEVWLELAATTDDAERKRRYLNMVLYLDPENQPAPLALFWLASRRCGTFGTVCVSFFHALRPGS